MIWMQPIQLNQPVALGPKLGTPGLHPYHVLQPLKRPLQHSWGPQKGPLWPIKPLLVAPEALGQPQGARFGPKCHWLVQLGGLHPDHVLRPLKRPLQHSWSPQKGPLWPIKSLLGPRWALGSPGGPDLGPTATGWSNWTGHMIW